MKLILKIHRTVLFEKFNIKHEMRNFLLSQLDSCEIKLLKDYPKSIFFIKKDQCLMEQDFKNEFLFIRYDIIWSIFQLHYKLSHEQIQVFIKDTLDEQLKLEGMTPIPYRLQVLEPLDEQLKLEGMTPASWKILFPPCLDDFPLCLDEQLKLEGMTL